MTCKKDIKTARGYGKLLGPFTPCNFRSNFLLLMYVNEWMSYQCSGEDGIPLKKRTILELDRESFCFQCANFEARILIMR